MIDIACMLSGVVIVPIVENVTPDKLDYILNETQLTCIAVSH